MKPYPNTWTGPEHVNENGHDADDFVNPVGLGRAILGYLAFLATVGGAVALGLFLGSK